MGIELPAEGVGQTLVTGENPPSQKASAFTTRRIKTTDSSF